MTYNEKFVDHFDHPRNVGTLDGANPRVGTGIIGSPQCGDVTQVQIQVDQDNRIVDAKFKTFGCGSAIASTSLATEWIKGKTLDEALGIKKADIANELSLPPVKVHCSVLAEDAIRAAIEDVKSKTRQPEVGQPSEAGATT